MHGVMYVLDSCPKTWGTREEFQYRICARLAGAGLQPVVVYSDPVPPVIRERLQRSGAIVTSANYARLGVGGFRSTLHKVVNEYAIDLAHIRFFDYFSAVPWILRSCGVKRIWFTEANSGLLNPSPLKRALLRTRTRLMAVPLTGVIGISDFIRHRLAEVGMPPARIRRVYNGVDMNRFQPRPHGELRQGDELVLLAACVLRQWKHVETIVEGVALACSRGAECRLFVAGVGPERENLERLADQLGIRTRVSWLGYREDLEWLLQGSDVFILASEGEAFGNVLAEAMGCGLPVLGAASGAIPEIVSNGETGILFPPRDANSLAEAILRLYRCPNERARIGIVGRKRAVEHFNVDLSVQETLRCYGLE